MNLYYWKAKPNFGDLLSSYLVKHYTGLDSTWAVPEKSELIVIGSILEHLPKNWGGVVAGAGKLKEDSVLTLNSSERILALRGPLTALGIKGSYVLADPALLADELIPMPEKEYDLGIIPHWSDTRLEHDPTFTPYKPKIIRVNHDPIKVITEIAKCKKIVSSSLHGIILADAFGIPRRTELAPIMLKKPKQEGGTFKWRDYNASIGLPFRVGLTQEADRNIIQDKQSELFDVFEQIELIFRKK